MEALFSMSRKAQQQAMLLRSKYAPKLQARDIEEVIDRCEGFVVCRLNQEARVKKYSGAQLVACVMSKKKNPQLVHDLLRRYRQ